MLVPKEQMRLWEDNLGNHITKKISSRLADQTLKVLETIIVSKGYIYDHTSQQEPQADIYIYIYITTPSISLSLWGCNCNPRGHGCPREAYEVQISFRHSSHCFSSPFLTVVWSPSFCHHPGLLLASLCLHSCIPGGNSSLWRPFPVGN
jgi:hypothetical protein